MWFGTLQYITVYSPILYILTLLSMYYALIQSPILSYATIHNLYMLHLASLAHICKHRIYVFIRAMRWLSRRRNNNYFSGFRTILVTFRWSLWGIFAKVAKVPKVSYFSRNQWMNDFCLDGFTDYVSKTFEWSEIDESGFYGWSSKRSWFCWIAFCKVCIKRFLHRKHGIHTSA